MGRPSNSDIIGKKFNMLTVIKEVGKTNGGSYTYVCKCDCGTEATLSGTAVKLGYTKSCGCLQKINAANSKRTHGLTESDEYTIWRGMLSRCYNKNHAGYSYYGGAGITVCDEWINSFETFYRDMGERPSKSHSIDRKEGDKDYSKNNCFWATKKEQSRNIKSNRWYEYNGRKMILSDWAKYLNIAPGELSAHLKTKNLAEVFLYFENKQRLNRTITDFDKKHFIQSNNREIDLFISDKLTRQEELSFFRVIKKHTDFSYKIDVKRMKIELTKLLSKLK